MKHRHETILRIQHLLDERVRQLDPDRSHQRDPHSQASLHMLRQMLDLMIIACEAEGIDEDKIEAILDRVIVSALPSPVYHLLLTSFENLMKRHVDLVGLVPPSPIRVNL